MASNKEKFAQALTQLTLGALQQLDAPLVAVALARFAAVAHLVGGGSRDAFRAIAEGAYDSERANQSRAAQPRGGLD